MFNSCSFWNRFLAIAKNIYYHQIPICQTFHIEVSYWVSITDNWHDFANYPIRDNYPIFIWSLLCASDYRCCTATRLHYLFKLRSEWESQHRQTTIECHIHICHDLLIKEWILVPKPTAILHTASSFESSWLLAVLIKCNFYAQ